MKKFILIACCGLLLIGAITILILSTANIKETGQEVSEKLPKNDITTITPEVPAPTGYHTAEINTKANYFDTQILAPNGEVIIASTKESCGRAMSTLFSQPLENKLILSYFSPGMDRLPLANYKYDLANKKCYEIKNFTVAYGGNVHPSEEVSPKNNYIAYVFEEKPSELIIVDLIGEKVIKTIDLPTEQTFNKGSEALCFKPDLSWTGDNQLRYGIFGIRKEINPPCYNYSQALKYDTYSIK